MRRGQARSRAGTRPELHQLPERWLATGFGCIRRWQSTRTSTRSAPLREPIHELGRNDFQTRLLTEADFFVDQTQRRLGAELRDGGRGMTRQSAARHASTQPPSLRRAASRARSLNWESIRNQRRSAAAGTRGPSIRMNRLPGRGVGVPYVGMLGYEGDAEKVSSRTAASLRPRSYRMRRTLLSWSPVRVAISARW